MLIKENSFMDVSLENLEVESFVTSIEDKSSNFMEGKNIAKGKFDTPVETLENGCTIGCTDSFCCCDASS